MNKVYLLGGARTPIGVKKGQFKHVLPEDLGAMVLKDLIKRYDLQQIDEIIGGNVVGPGGNLTRLMALKAGLPEEVVSYTVDMQCASATIALDLAYQKIKSGQCDLIIAGGFESTSLQPRKSYDKKDPRYNEEDQGFMVSQFSPTEIGEQVMLRGAERVVEKEAIMKEELDFWSIKSHQLAHNASSQLKDCIVEVNGIKSDEGIRPKMNQKLINRLTPLLEKDGKINASNACLMHDGAAFLILCSTTYLQKTKQSPKAEVMQTTLVGGNPQYSPTLALKAIKKLLDSAQMSAEQISVFEVNEAFAVIDVLFERTYPHLISRYNPLGGALAYGHPYGASGAIILLHLLKALELSEGEFGVSSIAAAGGLGSAMLIRKVHENELL